MNKKSILTVVLVFLCCITGAYSIYTYLNKDTDPPELYFNQGELVFKEGNNESVLLSGVTAYDDVDGDITDRIVIERILYDKEGYVTVTYAVMDNACNVAEEKRDIKFIASKKTLDDEDDDDTSSVKNNKATTKNNKTR